MNFKPAQYHTVTPYLIVSGAGRAIDFYKQAFGATEVLRIGPPGGPVGHAELQIGDSRIMLADEHPESDARSPQSIGGTPVGLAVYAEDVDAVVGRAVSLGAKLLKPVQDQFYGDRTGTVVDPFGHKWTIATHKEDVTPGVRPVGWLKFAGRGRGAVVYVLVAKGAEGMGTEESGLVHDCIGTLLIGETRGGMHRWSGR